MSVVRLKGDAVPSDKVKYGESWGFFQKHTPFRCYLCPDGTSELADISCVDPWYRELQKDQIGYSLVLVRTELRRQDYPGHNGVRVRCPQALSTRDTDCFTDQSPLEKKLDMG